MDWVGAKLGFTLAVFVWSAAAALTSLGNSVLSLSAFRGVLGLAEGANFPGGVKVVSEWFGPAERATAVGLFTSGASIGAIITPPLMAYAIVNLGWQMAFVLTALPGVFWILLWRRTYLPPEFPALKVDPVAPVRWSSFLKKRVVWGVFLARFLEEPVSWFYLTWLPIYMRNYRDASIVDIGLALVIPFIALDLGYMGGGWISSRLVKRGWSVDAARKTVMVAFALCMVAGIPAVAAASTAGFVAWVSLATFGHGGWASNVLTLPGDVAPKRWVGSVYGMTALGGGLGAIFFTQLTGYLVDTQHSFKMVFTIAGILPVLAAGVLLTVPGKIVPMAAEPEPA
jgi:MFS transporter, ACS family, hexuronate transporter